MLTSKEYIASCDGKQSCINLEYSWNVTCVSCNDAMLTSESRNPAQFYSRSFTFKASMSYTISLMVKTRPRGDEIEAQALAMIVISIISSDVVAMIGRGDVQSFRPRSPFFIDGSRSYNPDQDTVISFSRSGYMIATSLSLVKFRFPNDQTFSKQRGS